MAWKWRGKYESHEIMHAKYAIYSQKMQENPYKIGAFIDCEYREGGRTVGSGRVATIIE